MTNDTTFDHGEVIVLRGRAYLGRIAYFGLTIALVLAGTGVAIQRLALSPWDALYVLPIAFIATALGANTGYHMYFVHRSFTTTPFVRGFLAMVGTLLCQDSIVQWVANHKRHHRHVDIPGKDPHTPRRFGRGRVTVLTIGLWWASMGWKFDRVLTAKRFYASDLLDDPLVRWYDKHFVALSYGGFVLPFLLGCILGGVDLGVKWFAYFGALRVFIGYFFTEFVVNGLCHAVGSAKFRTGGASTNLPFLSPLTLGATLHHNHHAFPRVLSPAIDREIDPMKQFYWLLQRLGIIVIAPGPTSDQIQEKRISIDRCIKKL
ncbi:MULTISPECIES: fatty acid desaturase [unclassified Paraburkholderia]|uniref:fatty acid desaturase n=1 Tax=unclassified Paraburkholderia TaxID=2615204 RepID=UPI0016103C43|nr:MULTISPECIES: fatty acid desaturase [unclassified Paraburkholderia]MBB5447918.1 stearoyl-CoA desaturase (delta-9 desaturase) [Paraburkholderia sp. WSM4177]MBB5488302.1 stearoyl-CoA desaturase (delta-9 desaturase) [Paraburkholderia sp. WSM4180]